MECHGYESSIKVQVSCAGLHLPADPPELSLALLASASSQGETLRSFPTPDAMFKRELALSKKRGETMHFMLVRRTYHERSATA